MYDLTFLCGRHFLWLCCSWCWYGVDGDRFLPKQLQFERRVIYYQKYLTLYSMWGSQNILCDQASRGAMSWHRCRPEPEVCQQTDLKFQLQRLSNLEPTQSSISSRTIFGS